MTVELTDQDLEMLLSLAEGERPSETAERCGVSVNSVRWAHYALRKRLGARTSEHAVALAYHLGILKPRRA